MGERTRREKNSIRERILKLYQVEGNSRGTFFLQVDWLLENAVFPTENGYTDNLIDLWNVYMPNYKFDRIVLEYSKKYFPVLWYVHDREIYKFNSVKLMQENAIKNFVKFRISQGETNRVILVRECFDTFKDVLDRTKLYDVINFAIDVYFQNSEIEQYGFTFLKRFQDYTDQPYRDILERLADIHEQKDQALSARSNLYNLLKPAGMNEEKFQSLINILLCKIAVADGERKFSDVLETTWNNTLPGVPYNGAVYAFIEKYEKPYMNAACFSIRNIKNNEAVKDLYKDAVILCAVLEAVEKDCHYGLREVNDFWKRDGMKFANGYFFDDEYQRMVKGFHSEILRGHKADIEKFHSMLIEKITAMEKNSSGTSRELKSGSSETGRAASNTKTRQVMGLRERVSSDLEQAESNIKDRQIEELQERISELEEKVDNTEKEVLSQFISLLDSRKYDHVLGKLYRMAYVEETLKIGDIQRSLKNLFEIMNISGIDIYGEIGAEVAIEEIKRGRYRIEKDVSEKATVKYPGYRIGTSVILHPLAEEA